jgi:hypothetical protein
MIVIVNVNVKLTKKLRENKTLNWLYSGVKK